MEKLCFLVQWRESPGDPKPKKALSPSQTKPLGSIEGNGFCSGMKALKLTYKASRVLYARARANECSEKEFSTTAKEQSFEGRSPGVLGNERPPQGRLGQWLTERVAKP